MVTVKKQEAKLKYSFPAECWFLFQSSIKGTYLPLSMTLIAENEIKEKRVGCSCKNIFFIFEQGQRYFFERSNGEI